MTRLRLLLSALSGSLFLFEILLSRIFSYIFPYHFTAVAVSLALLGLSTGAYVRLRFFAKLSEKQIMTRSFMGLAAGLFLFSFSPWGVT